MKARKNSLIFLIFSLIFCSLGNQAFAGSIVAWGKNDDGQCNVPSPNTDFIAVAAGRAHSLGLKQDGSIVAWGLNSYDQCNIPAGKYTAIAAGYMHSLALKAKRQNGAETILEGITFFALIICRDFLAQ